MKYDRKTKRTNAPKSADFLIIVDNTFVLKTSWQKTTGSTTFVTAPGTYVEVGDTSRNNSALMACRDSGVVKSHDRKTARVLLSRMLECECMRQKRLHRPLHGYVRLYTAL